MEPQINESQSVIEPLKKVTPLSKYLAMVLFIILPFLGGWIGWEVAQSGIPTQTSLKSNETINADKPLATELESNSNVTTPVLSLQMDVIEKPILNEISDYVFAVEESKVRGPGRAFPVLSIYKRVNNQEPIKFATIGGVNEYPNSFALSPNKRKVAVNLESKLVIVDIATGEIETLFLAKYQIGGQISFSKDGSKIAFIDGSQYKVGPPPDYKYAYTLYILDLETRELQALAQNETFQYEHVESWQSNDRLVLSFTPAKGCALPRYGLLNTVTNNIEEKVSLNEGGMYHKDLKTQSLNSIVPNSCQSLASENMCGERAYTFYQKRNFLNSTNNIDLNDIGEIGKGLGSSIISPDLNSVLYSMYDLPTEALQCEQPRLLGYFLKDLVTGEVNNIDNLGDQLAKWGIILTDYSDKRIFISPVYKTNAVVN